MYEILFPTLSFPLNVYAQALWKQETTLSYLHYGLWQDGMSLSEAQQAATEMLLKALPPAPKHLLEVGIGLGTTARRLSEMGYDYTGITPDNHQILYARHRLQDMPTLPHFVHTAFEQFQTQTPLDVIVFQESAQYIQPTVLLQKCQALLNPGGQVVIMDEMTASLCQVLDQGLPNTGFKIQNYTDITKDTAPSISYLIQAIEQQREAVLFDLNISEQRLEGLMQSLKQRELAYKTQNYFYKLLVLEKS